MIAVLKMFDINTRFTVREFLSVDLRRLSPLWPFVCAEASIQAEPRIREHQTPDASQSWCGCG